MTIEKERIESIKRDVDLMALIESRSISLKKNGKSYKGLCPFHDDANPSLSVNPETNLWNCFGCNKGGDVIRFVELFDKIDFPQAVNQLSVFSGQQSAKSKTTGNGRQTTGFSVQERKLLSKVVSYYQHTNRQDSRGINYLKIERGIRDNQSIKDFGVGYVNGSLLETLPYDEDIIKALKRIGILNSKGHERFYNCVIFPLYDNRGAIANLYGRNIDDGDKVAHLFLPGPRTGLVNRQAVNRSQSIILTESIIDSLTLYDQGFKNVIPTYGVNGL